MKELSLCLFKPALVKNAIAVKCVEQLLHKENFQYLRRKKIQLSKQQAHNFYEAHSDKFFFERLIYSITSGPVIAYILIRNNAIVKWRQLMGPTKVFKCVYSHPNSIRGMFGLSDTRNATHGSDSTLSATKEIEAFFPDFFKNNTRRIKIRNFKIDSR